MIPILLTLENFASHSNSRLDFTQFDAALMVGTNADNPDISNGCGKTSLFQAMCWALYGKSKFSKANRVVKRGKHTCKVEFTFELSDGIYKVVRTLDIRSNLADVTFYRQVGEEWDSKPYTADTNTMTTKNIIEKLGISYDAFINVVYFQQNDISGFATAKTSDRKAILQDILQIGMWDQCQKQAKIEEKRLTIERDALTSRIEGLGNLEEEVAKNQKLIAEADDNLQEAKNEISRMEDKLHDHEEEMSNLERSLAQSGVANRRRLEEKKQLLKSKAEENKSRRSILKEKLNQNNEKISKYANQGREVEFQILKLSKDVLVVEGDARKDIEQLLKKMVKTDPSLCTESPSIRYKEELLNQRKITQHECQRKLDEITLQLQQLTALEPGKECPTCLTSLSDISSVEQKRLERKTALEVEIAKVQINLNEIEDIVEQERRAIKRAKDSYMEIQRLGLVLAKYQTSINEAERHNEEIQEEYKRLLSEWKELKQKNTKIKTLMEQTKNLNETQQELDRVYKSKKRLLTQLEKARSRVVECSVTKGHLEGYKEELERRGSERDTLISQRDVISFDVEAYSSLVRIFGRDGIQAIIMENMTEDLRSYTNSILQHLSSDPMSVDFVTQKQTVTGSWKEDFDIDILKEGETYKFDDLSGGEQVRVAFALRLALSRILMRRVGSSIRFLLLDEVDQSLDRHGIDVLAQAINGLTNEFKIIVITHNEYMKEKFEHIITVQKEAGGSTLSQ